MLIIGASRPQTSSAEEGGACCDLRCLSSFRVLIVLAPLQAPDLKTRGFAPLQGKGFQGPRALLNTLQRYDKAWFTAYAILPQRDDSS